MGPASAAPGKPRARAKAIRPRISINPPQGEIRTSLSQIRGGPNKAGRLAFLSARVRKLPRMRWTTSKALLAIALALAPLAAVADEAKPGEGNHAQSSSTPYFILDPMPISIIRDGVGRGILVVEIGLDAKTMDGRRDVEHMVPLLQDIYVRVLNLYTSRDLHIHQPANATLIKTRLQMATDQVLGAGKATVLMRQVLERRTQ
jgi:hypothetical protein